MRIVTQFAPYSSTQLPRPLLLPAPKRPHIVGLLSAPKITGYLPTPKPLTTITVTQAAPVRRVVEAEIANPLMLIDIRKDFNAWWAEFERIYGRVKTIEEMDAEIEAKHPGYLAWVARRKARQAAHTEAAAS